MNRTGRRRLAAVLLGSSAHLAAWLALRPDLAGPQWTDGRALEIWLTVQVVLAVAVGLLAPDRPAVGVTVAAGWFLQVLHFLVLGEHYDDTLWGIGVILMVLMAAIATRVALLVRVGRTRFGRR